MVRNAATVAGNICSGSPAADVVPPLLACDAEVTLASTGGTRVVPLHEFFLGYKEDARAAGELMTEIAWNLPQAPTAELFYKLARRKASAHARASHSVRSHPSSRAPPPPRSC